MHGLRSFHAPARRSAASRLLRTAWATVALVVLVAVASRAPAAGEFPGPQVVELVQEQSVVLPVRLTGRDTDDLVVGSSSGGLRLVRYLVNSGAITYLDFEALPGRVVDAVAWEGLPLQSRGVVVATADPDEVVFLAVAAEPPYLTVVQRVSLPEDPGTLAFVGDVLGGSGQLAVSLPGIDEVAFLAPDGDWRLAQTVATGDRPLSLAGIDLDDDGVRELVAAQRGYLSENLGVFRLADGAWDLQLVPAAGFVPGRVLAWDFDGDGSAELAVLDRDTAQAVVLAGVGGELAERARLALSVPCDTFDAVRLADGGSALVAASTGRGLVEMHLAEGAGWRRQGSYYAGCRPVACVDAEINGDGLPDLVSLATGVAELTLLAGHSGPGFVGFPAMALNRIPGSFGRGDFDGDGRPDVVVAGAEEPVLSLFAGRLDDALATEGVDYAASFLSGRLDAADLDGDGRSELLAVDALPGQIVVLDFPPEGGLRERSRATAGFFPTWLSVTDMDGDGRLDLLVVTQALQGVTVLYGLGDGSFGQRVDVPTQVAVRRAAGVDLDGDGRRDLVTADGNSRIWMYPNVGGRSFTYQGWVNAGAGAYDLAVADLDADGDADVVVGNRTDFSLSFLENAGGGLVRRVGALALTGPPAGLAVADFDGDGLDDVLVSLAADGLLSLVRGEGLWSWRAPESLRGTPTMTGVDVADFNADGAPDILTVDRSLRLGLTLLNVEPTLVAVEADALRVECRGDGWRLFVRPDRPGPWRLEVGGEDWSVVAADGTARRGRLELDGDDWILDVTVAELAPPAGGSAARRVRLTVGEGPSQESLVVDLDPACAGRTAALPRAPRWDREPWPNPFNPTLQAEFALERRTHVRVAVHDLAGRRVAVLLDRELAEGRHAVTWRGEGPEGPAAAGVYLLRVETPQGAISRKVALVR